MQAVGARHRKGLRHLLAAGVVVEEQQRRAQRAQGLGADLALAQALGQRERAAGPADRGLALAMQHAQLGLHAPGARQRRARRQRLQQVDGAPARGVGLGVAQQLHLHQRQGAQVGGLGARVGVRAVPIGEPRVRVDRGLELPGQAAFVGVRGEPVGQVIAGLALRDGLGVVRHGLPARAALQRLARRRGRERRDGARVARAHGVMHAPRERHRGLAGLRQRPQHGGMERAGGRRRQRVLDGDAGELVAEEVGVAGRVEQARVQALLDDAGRRLQQGLHQRGLDARWHGGGQADDGPRRGAEPGKARQHQVLHALRHALGAVAQHLADEQRIAARERMQAGGRAHRRARQLADGHLRQRRQREPRDEAGRQLADQAAQRVRGRDLVVAPRQHQQAGHAVDAPAQELQQVQRGVVGPVHVLEHGDHGPRAARQVGEHRLEQGLARVPGLQLRAEAHVGAAGDVVQRLQRVRRLQAVAGAPPRRGVAGARGQRLQQRGLADAGLAADQQHVAAAGARGVQQPIERQQRSLAFEQRHGVSSSDRAPP